MIGYIILGVVIILFLAGYFVGQALGESIANKGFAASKQVVKSVTGAVVGISLAAAGAGATHQIYTNIEKESNTPGNPIATESSSQIQIPTSPINEVVTKPPECAQLNLTPEELANCGEHYYDVFTELFNGCTFGSPGETTQAYSTGFEFTFSESGVSAPVLYLGYCSTNQLTKVKPNTYTYSCSYWDNQVIGIVTFNSNGFIFEETRDPHCSTRSEYKLTH